MYSNKMRKAFGMGGEKHSSFENCIKSAENDGHGVRIKCNIKIK